MYHHILQDSLSRTLKIIFRKYKPRTFVIYFSILSPTFRNAQKSVLLYVHACMRSCMHLCACVCVFMCVHVFVHVHMHVHMYVCVYMHMCICTCMHACVCA